MVAARAICSVPLHLCCLVTLACKRASIRCCRTMVLSQSRLRIVSACPEIAPSRHSLSRRGLAIRVEEGAFTGLARSRAAGPIRDGHPDRAVWRQRTCLWSAQAFCAAVPQDHSYLIHRKLRLALPLQSHAQRATPTETFMKPQPLQPSPEPPHSAFRWWAALVGAPLLFASLAAGAAAVRLVLMSRIAATTLSLHRRFRPARGRIR